MIGPLASEFIKIGCIWLPGVKSSALFQGSVHTETIRGMKASLRFSQWSGCHGFSMQRMLFVFLVFAIGAYGFFIEPYQVGLTLLDLRGEPVGSGIRGLVAVHLTDLHTGKIGVREKKVLSLVRELKPDLIFLTGDFVKWRGDYSQALAFLDELRAKHGVFGVLGDYDTSDSRKSCLFCHEPGDYANQNRSHGVRFLRDEILTIPVGNQEIRIGGMGFRENPDMNTIDSPDARSPQILLSHNPLGFDGVPDECETLVLAGDTHGGQIYLPSWAWRLLGYEKNEKYNYGLFSKGKKRLFVSRGIGTSHLPLRFFRRPEVVAIYF